MPANKTIEDELNNISPAIATLPKAHLSAVPEHYFENLPAVIISRILSDNTAGKNLPVKKETLSVPEGYFDDLSTNILAKVKESQVPALAAGEERYPLLESIDKINVFSVPPQYFENISGDILQKLPAEKLPAKVVSFNFRKVWKYVAAATITGLILISAFFMLNENKGPSAESQFAAEYKTPDQINKGIASLSDDEIVQYLENHGNILDNEMLIRDTDLKELPAAFDYFVDENTLNKYLDHVDSN